MRLPGDRLMERFAAEGLIKPAAVKTLHRLALLTWVRLIGALLSVPLFVVLLISGNAEGTLLWAIAVSLLWLAPVAALLALIASFVLYAGYGKKI